MRVGKKKESIIGVIITALLCLGFLWWWFRPAVQKWQEHDAVKLVDLAAKEPQPESRVERQVLDLDLLEVAFSQVREHRRDEALAVAKHISDPVIRTLAAKELAHAHISSDAKDLGEVIGFIDIAPDDQKSAVRADILGMLAAAGFPDAALPEAKTPLQKAVLANRISDADEKVRELLAAAQAALPSLPLAEAAVVRHEIAKARVMLARQGSPAEAFAAIKELPLKQRGELWADLAGVCQGRPDYETMVPLIFQQVEDPAVRRRMEIESLVFGVKVRSAVDIIADCQSDVAAAPSPAAKVAAMLMLSKAQYDGGEGEGGKIGAAETLKEALRTAQAINDPALRCRALLSLARRFSDVVQLDDSRAALTVAIAAARAVSSSAEQIPLLVEAEDESRKQADEAGAVKLMDEAVALIEKSPGAPNAATVESLASALVRRGQWTKGLLLVDRLKAEPERLATLEAVAKTAAEDSTSVDPANPPPRGEPFDTIRKEAIRSQGRAAQLTEAQPAGFARARAWLAMAKAMFTPPMSLTDYMAGGAQPGEGSGVETVTEKEDEDAKEEQPPQEK